MIKRWKTIIGFEDYKISNYGEVKSYKKKVEPKSLKLQKHKRGYRFIRLCLNGIKSSFLVHRLVAQHFLKDWDHNLQVDHRDEDKTNNREDNLRMCTNAENIEFYHSTRQYDHVCWSKDKKGWRAYITTEGQTHYICISDSKELCIEAYKYAVEHGIEDARQKYKKKHSSKYRGVYWQKNDKKWRVQIREENKNYRIGCFEKEEDALEARIYAEEFGVEKARHKYMRRK